MSNRILSYRSLLADGGIDTILLSTKKGEIGYRIHKFELMSYNFGHSASEAESTVKIFKEEQSTAASSVDFSDNRLIAAAQIGISGDPAVYSAAKIVIFDQEIFNQDIYITHKNQHSDASAVNYYLELEIIKLDESQAMVATLGYQKQQLDTLSGS